MGYTLRQFNAYLELAQERQRADMRWALLAPALGFNGGDGIKKALKALED